MQHTVVIRQGDIIAGYASGHIKSFNLNFADFEHRGESFYLDAFGVHPDHKECQELAPGEGKKLSVVLAEYVYSYASGLGSITVSARVRENNVTSYWRLKNTAHACGRDFIEVPIEHDYEEVRPEVQYERFCMWKRAREQKEAGEEQEAGEKIEDEATMLELLAEEKKIYTEDKIREIKHLGDLNQAHGLLKLYMMPVKQE